MRRRRCVIAGVLLVVAACGDPSGPGEVAGATFSLRPAAQVALPALMSATVNCDNLLYDGHLVVAPAGTASLTLNTVLDCTRVGAAPDTTEFAYTGEVSQSGAQVTFVGLPLSLGAVESSGGVARGLRTTLTASTLTLGAYVPLYFGRD